MRPFRFLADIGDAGNARDVADAALHAEAIGIDVLVIPDHLVQPMAPIPLLAAVAAVTDRLRIGTVLPPTELVNERNQVPDIEPAGSRIQPRTWRPRAGAPLRASPQDPRRFGDSRWFRVTRRFARGQAGGSAVSSAPHAVCRPRATTTQRRDCNRPRLAALCSAPLPQPLAQPPQRLLGELARCLQVPIGPGTLAAAAMDDLWFRRARGGDVRRLRALTRRSMAHWPRSQAFLAEANRLMSLSARDLEGDQAWLVEHAGAPIGYYRLAFEGEAAEIEELFVEPAWIGRGIGRRLFEHAVATARHNGCARLEWDSDNEARGFYLAMGGHVTGTRPSGMQGQPPLNRMRIDLNV